MNLLKKHENSENGLTLIEVLISISILGILLIVFMRFFLQAGTFTNLNEKRTVGINVARNALMFMEKQNFLQVKNEFSSNQVLNLQICDNHYTYFDQSTAIPSNCQLIKINNIPYNVTIQTTEDLSNNQRANYYIPLKVEAGWKINDKDYTSSVDGTIKSEDLR
ncbi:type II secretion system protein [Heyndrickxia acidicola]|uniref:Type II secretion system protein n=1 Tax=Heyndrickxia acidicola TaxID=209389 RepID=A0ABU6MMF6_9BACI|nr:type II secretion system protein [Heyndrickxia acidicola]MED1204808.1 type II secretion system protein [Heyndrickxia acidicola]